MGEWLVQNWFNVLSAIGIIASLLFTAVSVRAATKTQRITNLLALTQNHRELWSPLIYHADLKRVFDPSADLSNHAVTHEETVFVTMAVQHLHSAYQALQNGLVTKPEGVRRDIRQFFSLAIPQTVWRDIKTLHNDDFVRFVEECQVAETAETA
jgi:hypothetical protein